MKMNLQSVHFKADKKLVEFIQKKLDKLDLFYDKVIESEVFLKVENTSGKENKIVEVKIKVPKEVLFAEKTAESFEEATDLCYEILGRQLKRFKEKEIKDKQL